MAGLSHRLQRLLHDTLRQDATRGFEVLMEAVARAAGASGAVLWHRPDEPTPRRPSAVAMWLDDGGALTAPRRPDPVTVAAFETGTLALPAGFRGPDADRAELVIAALPVDEIEGAAGVLTLLGEGELTNESFDVVVDLLDILPELWLVVRERQSLALVRRCNDILHEADVEASSEPLAADRVSHYLSQVCAVIAEAVCCQEVSIYLQDPGASGGDTYPLVASMSDASTGTAPVLLGVGPVGTAIEKSQPVVAEYGGGHSVRRAVLASPVASGEHVWGAVACVSSNGSRPPFGPTDLASLDPATPQIARYWNGWLQRRTISEENESWRLLAAAVTTFNQLLSEQLGRKTPDDARVYAAALDVVRTVVPECVGGAVWLPAANSSGNTPLVRVASSGPAPAGAAHRPATQRVTTERDEIAVHGVPGDAGWLVDTPVRASHRRHGVLTVFGASVVPPPSSPQVCQIIADQLGLYQHLRQTLHKLQETRATLDNTLRSQAEALEDLEHQLVSPLLTAMSRTERALAERHLDSRIEAHVRAIRGLCRKSSRVAMAAGVFAALSKGRTPNPKLDRLGADDLLRLLIIAADDAQLLGNPKQHIEFTVDRDTVRTLGRRFIQADRGFLEQCVGNILDNATKYSHRHTRVDIGGRVDQDTFSVAVTNVGLELDPLDAERCLQRNWRGAAARTVTGEGSGLGLWITDNLMRSMRGHIRIRPAGETTTVLLGFPLP